VHDLSSVSLSATSRYSLVKLLSHLEDGNVATLSASRETDGATGDSHWKICVRYRNPPSLENVVISERLVHSARQLRSLR
jgi:hypothetical protein